MQEGKGLRGRGRDLENIHIAAASIECVSQQAGGQHGGQDSSQRHQAWQCLL